MALCNVLKKLRVQQGRTQQDIANAIGVAKSTYSLYETGKREPNVLLLKKIAKEFGTTGSILLSINDSDTDSCLSLSGNPPSGEIYALRIKGSGRSMEPRIFEGCTCIVQQTSSIEDGDIAVLEFADGKQTVKKIFEQEGGLLLVGLNSAAYSPKFFKDDEVKVIGKVLEVRSKVSDWNDK